MMLGGSMDRKLREPNNDTGVPMTDNPEKIRDPKRFVKGIESSFAETKAHEIQYEYQAGKFNITVLPNVFSPKYFTDSEWFAERLPGIVGKGSFLEMGTGTGISALYCAAAGARVDATDINPDASRNAALNAEKFGLPISVYNGNMFEPVGGKKYDFIFWNHPFNTTDEAAPEVLLKAGFDQNYHDLKRYVTEGKAHLNEHGALLLGTSDMADIRAIEKVAAENGYRLTLLESGDVPIREGSDIWNTLLIYRFDKIEKGE